MLPPTKRRSHEDAVTVVQKGLPKSHRAPKPEVFEESADSVTRMMAAPNAGDLPPPPSSRPARPRIDFTRANAETTVIRPMSEPEAPTFPAQIKAVRMARPAEKVPESDPPASTVTAKHFVLKGKPTAQWAMTLVAIGIFGGLATAVFVRGDGDAVVAAGAAFVDPGEAAQVRAANELQPLQRPAAVETLPVARPLVGLGVPCP